MRVACPHGQRELTPCRAESQREHRQSGRESRAFEAKSAHSTQHTQSQSSKERERARVSEAKGAQAQESTRPMRGRAHSPGVNGREEEGGQLRTTGFRQLETPG
jgi:hypothetical protein